MESTMIRLRRLGRVGVGFLAILLSVSGMPLLSAGQAPDPPLSAPVAAPMRTSEAVAHPPGTGFIAPPMDLAHLTAKSDAGIESPQVLPGSFDWRSSGVVTSVKDQANCGSCYAFAFVGGMESKVVIDTGGAATLDLSENHAKECNWRELNNFQYPDPGDYWGSCDGGNSFMVANLFSQDGTVLEACDPYSDSDVACGAGGCTRQHSLQGWSLISGSTMPDTTTLKQYLYDHGPIITSMYVDPAYNFDGSYNGSWTFNYPVVDSSTNHGVLIVGWSDNLPPVPGGVTPAEGWIVKNSWGPSWGDSGYFYVTYGKANVGLWSSYVDEWQPYDPDGDLWYYDDDGWWTSLGWTGHTTAWALAKYTPDRDTTVTDVEFYTTDTTTDVDVYLYDSFDGSNLTTLLAQKLNSSFAEAGYHSVQLSSPLSVYNGNDVIAVVKFTTAGYEYPIAVDTHGAIESGKTYISQSGSSGSWFEMGGDGYDVTVRLRTSAGGTTGPSVTSITPSSGPNTGVVSITNLSGSNFQAGATVKLAKSGEPDIHGNSVNVVNPTRITCTFDLTGATTGAWDVVVTNPDTQSGTLTSGFTLTPPIEDYYVYLPSVLRRYPPVPFAPTLYDISNPDGDGSYLVDWSSADLATSYELEEDDNPAFSSPTTAYSGSGTSKSISGKAAGTYYYRVRGRNSYGPGPWSNTRSVAVTTFCLRAAGDTTILQGYPTSNFSSTTDMWVGYDHCLDPSGSNDGLTSRSLLGFDLSGIPSSTSISQAMLVVYHTNYCDIGQRTHTVQVFRISTGWDVNTVTWNTQPGFAEPYGWNNVTSGDWGWYGFDVTGLVRGWVQGYIPNLGLMLRGPEAPDSSGARLGFSTLNSSNDPLICISTSTAASLDNYVPPAMDGPEAGVAASTDSISGLLCDDCCQTEPNGAGYLEGRESLPQ